MSKKVVLLVLHSELESAYPPLNIAVGAISSQASVVLAFMGHGIDILANDYIPTPSNGCGYLANGLCECGAPSVSELLDIAVDFGVLLVTLHDSIDSNYRWKTERHTLHWLLNEATDADLFMHF